MACHCLLFSTSIHLLETSLHLSNCICLCMALLDWLLGGYCFVGIVFRNCGQKGLRKSKILVSIRFVQQMIQMCTWQASGHTLLHQDLMCILLITSSQQLIIIFCLKSWKSSGKRVLIKEFSIIGQPDGGASSHCRRCSEKERIGSNESKVRIFLFDLMI